MGGPGTPQKTITTDDFGFRIEISSSNPGQNDRTDLAHLFSIVAWPGKAIFASKSRNRLEKLRFSRFRSQNRALALICCAVGAYLASLDLFLRSPDLKIRYLIGFLVLS